MSLLWENLVLCSSHARIFWLVSANSPHCRVSHATNRLAIACTIKKLDRRQWSKTNSRQNLPLIFDFTFSPEFWARSDPVGGKGIIYPKMSGRTGIRASAPPANNTPYEDSGTLAQKAPFAGSAQRRPNYVHRPTDAPRFTPKESGGKRYDFSIAAVFNYHARFWSWPQIYHFLTSKMNHHDRNDHIASHFLHC